MLIEKSGKLGQIVLPPVDCEVNFIVETVFVYFFFRCSIQVDLRGKKYQHKLVYSLNQLM